MRKAVRVGVLLLLAAAAAGYYYWSSRVTSLVLTGIVTTDDIIVSSQISGQIGQLLVAEGQAVTKDQLLAVIAPDELRADSAYYTQAAAGATATVQQNEAALRYEQQQADAQVGQAEAALAASQAAQKSAESDLENARLTYQRNQALVKGGAVSNEQFDQSRTAYEGLQAHVASLAKQVDQAQAAVTMAKAQSEQVSVRRGQLDAAEHQQAAANAQRTKADVRLAYTEIHAPIAGLVETRAALQGEVVSAGQPIVTIVNPDNLWVRVDVEESYIDRVRVGDSLTVRLPSGTERQGTVFYRGVDAGFATQRDVSRTKRDIKTFEIRLRMDNQDRRLAVGMTAQVLLPLE